MPDPESTEPSTTPDQRGDVYHVTPEFETEMKGWGQSELEAFWRDVANALVGQGEAIAPYASPSGDATFENRVNGIIQGYVAELTADPDLAKGDAYAHHTKDQTTQQPAADVAAGADPVTLFNGNFAYSSTDFHINGAGMDCVFVRSYSQLSLYKGPLGFNWDHSFNLWLRISPDRTITRRSTGALREEVFKKHEQFEYWIPPDGTAGILVEAGDSFVLRRPDGARIVYQPHQTLHPFIHVVARIEDRFGNHLSFTYADGRLIRIEVNHPERILDVTYDTEDRIVAIRDFSGRVWRYDYDTLGDLVAVTLPATAQHKRGSTTCYEYTGVLTSDQTLQHNLISIVDADGRLYLENEFGTEPHLLTYGRVVRQRQGGGDVTFDYADLIEDFAVPYEVHERPTHQTIVTERDGRQARYLFNRLGNMIFKEEYARLDGVPKLVSSHYRYNRDGRLVATISPLGAIAQALYGRDFFERQFPRDDDYRPETDSNLTPDARLRFDDLLSVVKRGTYHNVTSLNLAGGLWSGSIFPDILQTNEHDAIQKFTYEAEFGQPLTASDPRFTRSASPAFVEDAEYHRRLTRYAYLPGLGFQHLVLDFVELPTPILPDGTPSDPVRTRFPTYDARGRVLATIAPNGLRTHNEYSGAADGRLEGFLRSVTIDPGGLDIRRGIGRDQLGRVVRVCRPQSFDFNDGRFCSTAEYNELSQIVRLTGTPPFSISTRNTYSRVGSLSRSETDLKDHANAIVGSFATRNRYDDELNLVAQRIGDGEDVAVKETKAIVDRASRPFLTIAPSGRKKKTSFNERSLVAKVVQDYGGVHAVTRGSYDADGRLVRVVDPRGAVTRFAYDALGRLIDTEDAKGNRIIRHFDKIGNLLVECLFEKQGADAFVLLFRRQFSYDELGRQIVAAANKFEPPAAISASQVGQAFRESGPGELLTIESFYDSVGNLVKEVDQDGRGFVAEYDILGRPIRRVDPMGNEVRLTYDKEGNVLRVDQQEVTRDPVTNAIIGRRHFAEAFRYDELNRLVERRTPTGSLRYKYDSRGNQVEIEDPLGHKVEHDYDVFSRQIETRQSLHRRELGDVPVPVGTRFAYDLDDQKTAQIDALDRPTRFQYDTAGRLIATALPDGVADSFAYDRFGNLTEYRDRNGLIRRFEWDELNRNAAMRIDASGLPGNAAFPGATDYRCEHDALGRFTAVENDFVVTRFGYNSLNHLLTETSSFTEATGLDPTKEYAIQREFVNSGAVVGLTSPSGRQIRYSRDILDRVVRVEQVRKGDGHPGDPATPDSLTVAAIDYEGLQPRRITRHNGISTAFKHDFSGRTIEIAHSSGAQNILTLQFLYDALGNMRARIEVSGDHQSTEHFRYDSLSRLFEAARSGTASLLDLSSITPPVAPLPDPLPDRQPEIDQLVGQPSADHTSVYEYDLAGNRVSTSVDGITEPYETNELDHYTKVNGAPRLYDANGNLIEDDVFVYRYDYRNQLAQIERKSDDQETRFLFDYFGRSCVQQIGAQSRIVLYDRHTLLEQYDGDQLVRSVISNTKQDGLIVSSSGGAENYFLVDLTGSVRYLFAGAVQRESYLYDEFGGLRSAADPADDNPFRFAGKRLLGDTGMYDFVYRTYDPAVGRFVQRDPKGFVDGTNLYAFVSNNPLVFTDALGLESRSEHPTLSAKLGAELAYRHPKGFTLAVPNNFDNDKIRTYKERINNPTDRGVGIRSRPTGAKTSTADIRRANRALRDAFEANLPGGRRPAGTQIDHSVELQHIIRGNAAPGADTVRPQDHRVQNSSLNASQGSTARAAKERQVRNGAPLDTSAGGIARERDVNKFWNREGYRTGVRYFGHYNLVGGTFASLSSIGDDIREGNFGSAALNTSGYVGGALETGGILARSTTLLNAGRYLGAPAAVFSSGVLGVRIGTNLYENYVDKEMYMDAGSWVEEHTGSRVLGATAAAVTAVGDAIVSAPEAAYDYATETWTVDPDDIDWDRTFKPWKWF